MVTSSKNSPPSVNVCVFLNEMDHIVVDTTLNQKLPIGLDITFPNLRCDEVSVDTVDSTGDNQVDVSGTLHKQSLDAQGKESKVLFFSY